jgi:PilZ domain-containing protein
MEQERRSTLRFAFDASADVIQENSDTRIVARVSEIGMNGCLLKTADPFPDGTPVVVKIFTEGRFFEARATVVYSQAKIGMGLAFREVKPHFVSVLKKWLLGAMLEKQKAQE